MANIDTVFRTDPGSGQVVGVATLDDRVKNISSIKVNRSVPTNIPLNLLLIADTVTSGDFPADGTGTISGATSTTISLGTGVFASSTGLLVAITSGVGVGQIRRISSFSSPTATVDTPWITIPSSGTYTLLIDCNSLTTAWIAPCFSSASTAETAVYSLMLYDSPATTRAPFSFIDTPITVENYGFTNASTAKAGYYHGRGYSVGVGGWTGYKVRLVSVSSGNVSISAGAS